jgi:hypothetical protein
MNEREKQRKRDQKRVKTCHAIYEKLGITARAVSTFMAYCNRSGSDTHPHCFGEALLLGILHDRELSKINTLTPDQTTRLLDDVDAGKITVDEAVARIRGNAECK